MYNFFFPGYCLLAQPWMALSLGWHYDTMFGLPQSLPSMVVEAGNAKMVVGKNWKTQFIDVIILIPTQKKL